MEAESWELVNGGREECGNASVEQEKVLRSVQ